MEGRDEKTTCERWGIDQVNERLLTARGTPNVELAVIGFVEHPPAFFVSLGWIRWK